MEVSRVRALRGPNLWSRRTAIEAVIQCSAAESSGAALQDLSARLHATFPELGVVHNLPHALAATALRLQIRAGCAVSFLHVAETADSQTHQIVVEYSEEAVGRLAIELAHGLCAALIQSGPFDLEDAITRLHDLDEDQRLGPSTASIVRAATARGIPFTRLTEGSLVRFGWGSRARRIQAAETSESSAIAESIAQDKALTKTLLNIAGIPVPQGRQAESADDAWAAAQEIGLPVVVKPRDGNQGKGVAVNLTCRDQVRAAYDAAAEIRRDVLVEQYFPGHDFRLLVVGNRLVAAARRDPPQVTGDGVSSVQALIDIVNADPRRGSGHATSLTKIPTDAITQSTLAEQGLTLAAVPAAGHRVVLRNNCNLSTGGSATDVTAQVHPELAECAVDAARMVGLDVCGIDIVCQTVEQPLAVQGGGIVEVNAAPGLRMHLDPSYGSAQPVGEAIIDALFDADETGRIPVVAVTGNNGKTTTVRLIAHLLALVGHRVGMTGTDGVWVDGRRIDTGDCSGPVSARSVLAHPDVDAAVFETARGGMLREGLAFDRCDVAVVTNIGRGDHLGMNFIETAAQLANVKGMIVRNVAPKGMAVLNAADPLVAEMAKTCPGAITFFARDRHHPLMAAHRVRGNRVVFEDNGSIVAVQGNVEHRFALSDIPFTGQGQLGFQVENAMAAIAAVWALGLDWNLVRCGLESFSTDAAGVPGRFNVSYHRGATVIADYGHNPDAMIALVEAVESMPARRRSVVISGAGDRRDIDLSDQTRILGQAFDDVVLYQDACQRGRADGEVLALLRQGLSGARRTRRIDEIQGEFLAIDTALGRLRPGDLCLILVDQVEQALAHIAQRIDGLAPVIANQLRSTRRSDAALGAASALAQAA